MTGRVIGLVRPLNAMSLRPDDAFPGERLLFWLGLKMVRKLRLKSTQYTYLEIRDLRKQGQIVLIVLTGNKYACIASRHLFLVLGCLQSPLPSVTAVSPAREPKIVEISRPCP